MATGHGSVFEKMLAAGESVDIAPSEWLYKDASVMMETKVGRLTSGLFGGMSLIGNRFTGPGRVGLQSIYMHSLTEN